MDETLLRELSLPISRVLIQRYLGSQETSAVDLNEITAANVPDPGIRRRAIRVFEDLGDRGAAHLESLLSAQQLIPTETNAVLHQLAVTLSTKQGPQLFEALLADEEIRLRATCPPAPSSLSNTAIRSYERLLSAALRLLRETAAGLPPFRPSAIHYSIGRLELSRSRILAVLDEAQRIEAHAIHSKEQPEVARIEADFRHEVVRTQDYLELFGADISPESRRHALSVAYVSLNIDSEPEDEVDEQRLLPAAALLESFRPGNGRLLIRGDAGSGKSTLFRWAALKAASQRQALPEWELLVALDTEPSALSPLVQQAVPDKKAILDAISIGEAQILELSVSSISADGYSAEHDWKNRLPFLIRLRDCPTGYLPGPDKLAVFIAELWPVASPDWINTQLETGRALLLFDGVDEVPNQKRAAIAKSVREIVARYPDNYYLLSTRPEAVQSKWLTDIGFREARISPMSDGDRAHLIDNWHKAVGAEIERSGRTAAQLPELARALKEQIANNPQIARLGTNPLLCGMICALHRDRHTKLPQSLSELCEALCQMLLHRREDESRLDLSEFPEPYRKLTYEQKRHLVQQLAHHMVLNEESAVDVKTVEGKLGELLAMFAGGRVEDAPIVRRTLVERSGMLREARPGRIDFIHNTLKEFLAAESFARGNDIGFLLSRALDDAWQPVLVFAAATRQASQGFSSDLIARLLDGPPTESSSKWKPKKRTGWHPTPRDGSQRAYKLVAVKCATVALTIDLAVRHRLDEAIRPLFPPQTFVDAEVLAFGGNDVVPLLRFKPGLGARVAAACVRALHRIGTPVALAAIREYKNSQYMTVLEEVCQAIDPLECPTIQTSLCSNSGVSRASIGSRITNLDKIQAPSRITQLNLYNTSITDCSMLSRFKSLYSLTVRFVRKSDVKLISELTELRELTIFPQWGMQNELDLRDTKLEKLNILGQNYGHFFDGKYNKGFMEILVPETLSSLTTWLPLRWFNGLKNISYLNYHSLLTNPSEDAKIMKSITNLAQVIIHYAVNSEFGIHELNVFNEIDSIKEFHLSFDFSILKDLSCLREAKRLTHLNLRWAPITDLSPLSDLPNLIELDIRGTPVQDISPVRHVKQVFSDHPTKLKPAKPLATDAPRVDVALLIALQEEFAHLLQQFGRYEAVHKNGNFYYLLERTSAQGTKQRLVATMVGDMGPMQAAVAAERLNQNWHPPCMAMLGIAGGINEDVRLGDVVLATQVDAYQENARAVSASVGEGYDFRLSGEVYRSDEAIVTLARNMPFAFHEQQADWLESAKKWQEKFFASERASLTAQELIRSEPQLHVGHIACGTTVSADKAFCEFLKKRDRKLLAIEMESAGMLAAARGTRTLVLRGISDFGDERKSALDRSQGGNFRTYAMLNAVGVFFALLDVGALG